MSKHTLPAALVTAAFMAISCGGDAPENPNEERAAPFTIEDIGLQTPESVVYDEQADVYLVSNINGEAAAKDDNGFIARIRPNGGVDSLHWIDGARPDITLHGPKGLALLGDTLFVSDIDSVRAFNRATGAPMGARGVQGAAFLNDLTVGHDGTLYVTDTGVDASFQNIGKDAIYGFGVGGASQVAGGADLKGPNGIYVDQQAIYMASYGGNTIWRRSMSGGLPETITLPKGQLDGLLRLGDGSLLVSSWEGKAVYRVAPNGQVTTAVEDVESPADIGWDARRNRLLVPLFTKNAIEVRELQ